MTIANYLSEPNTAEVFKQIGITRDWLAYWLHKLNDGVEHKVAVAVWFTDFPRDPNQKSVLIQGTMHKTSQLAASYWENGEKPAVSLFANESFNLGLDNLRDTQLMALAGNLALTYLKDDPDRADRVLRLEFQHTKNGETWNHEFSASWNWKTGRFSIICDGAVKVVAVVVAAPAN
jgi:hypothetical protein